MNQLDMQATEKVTGIVTGLEVLKFMGMKFYIAVFTNQRIIFIKSQYIWSRGGSSILARFLHSGKKEGVIIERIEKYGIQQLLEDSDIEKVIINGADLDNINFSFSRRLLHRIKFTIDSKKYKFDMDKETFQQFKTLFEKLKNNLPKITLR